MKTSANGKSRASPTARRRAVPAARSKLIQDLWDLIKPSATGRTVTSRIVSAHLRPEEQREAMHSANRRNLVIRGALNPGADKLALWIADGSTVTVNLSSFKPSGDGTKPKWSQFKIIDFGQTLQFGKYEAAVDAVLDEQRRRERKKTG